MKTFTCQCGQTLYFDNTSCLNCGQPVGFDPASLSMVNLVDGAYKPCANAVNYNVCNWVLPINSPDNLCTACQKTHVIPDISESENVRRWSILESAKRRLLYSVLKLGLPMDADSDNGHPALGFVFIEDRNTNPHVAEEYVRTGHANGIITINLSEADDVQREMTRSMMNEAYRTPLGHCRHEIGHYYYDRLIHNSVQEDRFRLLFGDPDMDYESALQQYYSNPPMHEPENGYISLYAQSHPLEDWAECWAHYMHIIDTLETARATGITGLEGDWILSWLRLSVILNELNSSMGQPYAYPFVLTQRVIIKLRFIHLVVSSCLPN